jgi:hypothetical protein
MPTPCPDTADAGCNGPFRVQFRLTFPADYEEQWVPPPGGGIPISRVSEVQVALEQALNDMFVDFTATVSTWDDSRGTELRSGLVKAGATLTYRGTANHEESLAAEAEPEVEALPDGVQVWTAEVWTHSAEPPTAEVLDYAYITGLWASALDTITVGSGVDALVLVEGVWIAATLPAEELDPEYPPADRSIEIAAA